MDELVPHWQRRPLMRAGHHDQLSSFQDISKDQVSSTQDQRWKTFEHDVWNNTAGTSVVLFVDVIRPLPVPSSLVNKLVVNLIRWSAFVQNKRKNVDAYTLDVPHLRPQY